MIGSIWRRLQPTICQGRRRRADLELAVADLKPTTLDWLRTARNLVKYAGADDSYADVERYIRQYKLL